MAILLDFKIIKELVAKQKIKCTTLTKTGTFNNYSNVFYFVALKLLFNLSESEIDTYITDQCYLTSMGYDSGKDGGIDAIYVEDIENKKIVHIFTFKYTEKENAALEAIPSSVLDSVLSFVNLLSNGDITKIPADYNNRLKSFTQQIFKFFAENDVKIIIHICGNYSRIDSNEKDRFKNALDNYQHFFVEYNLLDDLVDRYLNKNRIKIDGKMVVKKKEYFVDYLDENEGYCSTLIAKIEATMLLKLLSKSQTVRNKVTFNDSDLADYELEECAFDDNVRMFLGLSKINDKMLKTIESSDRSNFYYYNNGITILCRSCKAGASNNTTFTIKDIQIVNGSQTVHNLAQICRKSVENLHNVYILCRFYAIDNHETHANIAEYTNSQHQVKHRDIKALDIIQIKLEREFELLDIRYERKKNQYKGEKRSKYKKIDSEKCGQMLVAFYNEDPAVARNNKEVIFTTMYDDIFNTTINAEKILIVKNIYDYIDEQRKNKERQLTESNGKYLFQIKYSNYFHLFGFKLLCDKFITIDENRTSKYCLSPEEMSDVYEIVNNLLTCIACEKLLTSPNIDLSDYFKSNTTKNELVGKINQINSTSLVEAKRQAEIFLHNAIKKYEGIDIS